jgi:hypothetical protein
MTAQYWCELTVWQRYRVLNLFSHESTKTKLLELISKDFLSFCCGSSPNNVMEAVTTTISTFITATPYPNSINITTTRPQKVALTIDSSTTTSLLTLFQYIIPHLIHGFDIDIIHVNNPENCVFAQKNKIILEKLLSMFQILQTSSLEQQQQQQQQQHPISNFKFGFQNVTIPVLQFDMNTTQVQEYLIGAKESIQSVYLIGPQQSFTSTLQTELAIYAPKIIVTATQPGTCVSVVSHLNSESGDINDIISSFSTHLISFLNPSRLESSSFNTRHNIVYIHTSIIDEFMTKLAHTIKQNVVTQNTSAIVDKSALTATIETAFDSYSLTTEESTLINTKTGAIMQTLTKENVQDVINDTIFLCRTVHWASADLLPLSYGPIPILLCIPYRTNHELLNFLSTAVNTANLSIFSPNVSETFEISHSPTCTINSITINSFPNSTQTLENSLKSIANDSSSGQTFTQDKENGVLNPFIHLNKAYYTHHSVLTSSLSSTPTSNHKPQHFPSITKFPSLSSFSNPKAPIDNTIKQYINGTQCRSEGEYSTTITLRNKTLTLPAATRKDIRDAVEAAASAQYTWARTSSSLRLQILLYLAENLTARYSTLLPRNHLDEINQIVFNASQYSDKYGGQVDQVQFQQAQSQFNYSEDFYINTLKLVNQTEQLPFATANRIQQIDEFKYVLYQPHGVVVLKLSTNTPFITFLTILLPFLARGNTVIVLFHIDNNIACGPDDNTPISCVELITQFYQVLETTGLKAVHILFVAQLWDDSSITALNHLQVNCFCTMVDTVDEYSLVVKHTAQTSKNLVLFSSKMFQNRTNFGSLIRNSIDMAVVTRHIKIKTQTSIQE